MTGQASASKVDRRPLLWGGATVALLGLVLLLWKGPNTIRQWQHQRFLAQGKELLAAGNYQEAGFSIRKAILKAPGDPESYRRMADLAERVGSPQAAQ
jgi:Tfp pilus assembly protein PilF